MLGSTFDPLFIFFVASGAPDCGSGRIGKRVRFPRGPATVMSSKPPTPSATDLNFGKAVGGKGARKRTRETKSGDLPASLTAAVSPSSEGAGRTGAISNQLLLDSPRFSGRQELFS